MAHDAVKHGIPFFAEVFIHILGRKFGLVRGCLMDSGKLLNERTPLKKRRREALDRKRNPGFYSKTAGKGFDDMDEGTSFWGHKGLQKRFGKVDGS